MSCRLFARFPLRPSERVTRLTSTLNKRKQVRIYGCPVNYLINWRANHSGTRKHVHSNRPVEAELSRPSPVPWEYQSWSRDKQSKMYAKRETRNGTRPRVSRDIATFIASTWLYHFHGTELYFRELLWRTKKITKYDGILINSRRCLV